MGTGCGAVASIAVSGSSSIVWPEMIMGQGKVTWVEAGVNWRLNVRG